MPFKVRSFRKPENVIQETIQKSSYDPNIIHPKMKLDKRFNFDFRYKYNSQCKQLIDYMPKIKALPITSDIMTRINNIDTDAIDYFRFNKETNKWELA